LGRIKTRITARKYKIGGYHFCTIIHFVLETFGSTLETRIVKGARCRATVLEVFAELDEDLRNRSRMFRKKSAAVRRYYGDEAEVNGATGMFGSRQANILARLRYPRRSQIGFAQ
jgi:hypothetical protein